ncbi:hypothetical protein AB0M45_31255 [Nocardia sp. NPDC051787]|uniref:hypothetical protein n=1 Tax=Nocardia sp. NPDC051787 TaxID=3155415 RepID=UPI0034324197
MAAEQTKTGSWWAPIGLGAALCVACCLAPILIAAGIIGSGTILLSLSWMPPLGFALLAIGVAGLIWSRTRARRTGCATPDATTDGGCTSSGCGCTTAATR